MMNTDQCPYCEGCGLDAEAEDGTCDYCAGTGEVMDDCDCIAE